MRPGGAVAIVTGSTRGIGRAVVDVLAAHDAKLVVHGKDPDRAQRVAGSLPGQATAVGGEITDCDVIERLVSTALDRFGGVDIVVNNAGFNWDGPLEAMPDEQLALMLDVHVAAPMRLLRTAAPHLLRASEHQRKVVNVSSISGSMGSDCQVAYSAAKAAIIGATKALAKEWGPHGVNVNAVAPGFIETRLTAPLTGEQVRYSGAQIAFGIPAERRTAMAARVPLGRPGTAREVGEVIAFLCSQASNYVHGQVLTVSGGIAGGLET